MLRKLYVGISCFVVCLVLLLGCQDGIQQVEPLEPAATLAVRAQQQFESQALNAGSVNFKNPRGYMAKTPQWQLAYPVDLSVGQGLMVPVYYDEPFYLTSNISGENKLAANAVTNLLVYTGADGALHYELLSSFPGNGGGPFSGVIYVEDWHGNALKHYQYTGNGAINLLKSAGDSPSVNGRAQVIEVCYYYTTWAHSAHDPEGYYREEFLGCEYFVIDDGSDAGGGPSGGDYGGGGDSTPPGGGGSPCAPLTAARAPAPCDGGGGDGTQPTPTQPTPPVRKEIKNDIIDPCPRDQVNRLASNSFFLQSMFGIGDKMTMTYMMGSLGAGVDADTRVQTTSGGYFTVTTTLDGTRMTGASNEYIMATLIHEMYHAKRAVADPANTNSPTADHDYMAKHLNEMASLLQSFFPSMLQQTARDLSWGGLGLTSEYGRLSVSERIRIEKANLEYQTGVRGSVCAM